MKTKYSLFLIVFMVFSCSNPVDVVEDNNSQKKDLEKVLKFCVNNGFPPSNFSPSMICGIIYQCGGDEENITANEGAKLWSSNVTNPNGSLGCGFVNPPYIKQTSILINGYPGSHYLTWSFVYCHKYKIQKRINSGSWQTVKTYEDCKVSPRQWYIDEVASDIYDPGCVKLEYSILTEIFGNSVRSNVIVLWKIIS